MADIALGVVGLVLHLQPELQVPLLSPTGGLATTHQGGVDSVVTNEVVSVDLALVDLRYRLLHVAPSPPGTPRVGCPPRVARPEQSWLMMPYAGLLWKAAAGWRLWKRAATEPSS